MGGSTLPESDADLTVGITGHGEIPEAPAAPARSLRPVPERVGDRYRVQSELGRGGMAVVYRVIDSVSGRELALKQLAMLESERFFREQAAAFEREYHTLVQLSHPRIIEVYEFGADANGRYYTMELLDGGDLKERSPLPWREACTLLYDVCSSLALLHSRRLVHRDVSPRNVRSTRDGKAKLIDFGALIPMGTSGQIVGTAPFLPPEVLHRSTLDARTDLFSLGATLYFVLTGRLAYPARDFSKLHEAWSRRPAPPSAATAGIPAALDALVMSLISIDPAMRPRSAFEVMQRLAAIAGIERNEAADVSQAYLSTPVLVGREQPLATLRQLMVLALGGRGSGALIQGTAGAGRSRLLDACALEAKIAGATVLRVNAGSGDDEVLGIGQALAAQIVEELPELATTGAQREQVETTLFDATQSSAAGAGQVETKLTLKNLTGRGGDRPAIQSALTRWLLRVAKVHPLVILIDDVHRVDEASLALLAALVLSAPKRRLMLLATAEAGAQVHAVDAFNVLKRECVLLELQMLSREHTEALLCSVFGDVPNLALVSARLFEAAAGNPGETVELVQSLLAKGSIRYEGGQWVLPGRLEAAELPSSAAEGCRRRVAALSPLARLLGEVHALASHKALSREDYALAAREVASSDLDRAITELLSQRVLSSDGHAYVLSRREWSDALLAELDAESCSARHRALADVYAKDEALALERTHHLLAGGCEQLGLDLLTRLLFARSGDQQGLLSATKMSAPRVAVILDRGLTSAERLGRSAREVNEIRRGLFAISIVSDEAYYFRAAPVWFSQLERDSGLAFYERSGDAATSGERLMRALTRASEQYAATPEAERVYDPEAAIRNLVYYVAISIAIGSRVQDCALIASLPNVLEPFVSLSPLIHAMWQNSIATRETVRDNRPEVARNRWLEVDVVLSKITAAEMSYIAALRGAIAYGMGLVEARLGFASAEERARTLDDDPYQKVSAMSLRRIARLHQGDFVAAERFRKQAELLALQANQRQMFSSTLTAELIAYALASDLTGIREIGEAIEPLAARFPGWACYKHLADGYFEQTRGQFEAARQAFERGLAVSEPDPQDPRRSFGTWPRLEGAYIEALVSLDRAQDAKARGELALRRCAEHHIGTAAFVIRRALALAEAKLGDYRGASQRLQNVIADLTALEITGLELGVTYEARARIAIWASDKDAVEHFSRLTAKEYRYGEGSPLGARYERLMDEARSTGVVVLSELTDFHTKLTTAHWRTQGASSSTIVDSLAAADTAQERADRALQLLCEARTVRSGHLYLQTEEGLQLVASRGESTPDPGLKELVARHIGEQLGSDDVATTVETENAPHQGAACWLDQHARPHQVLLLMGDIDGIRSCAGAAVIESDGRSETDRGAQQLLDDLGRYLLHKGDARGIASADLR